MPVSSRMRSRLPRGALEPIACLAPARASSATNSWAPGSKFTPFSRVAARYMASFSSPNRADSTSVIPAGNRYWKISGLRLPKVALKSSTTNSGRPAATQPGSSPCPAVIRLRTRFAHVPRPYQVPGGSNGFVVLALIALAWIVLGSWVALFPGTLEPLFGIDYPFEEIWGLSRMRFEVFTLGTMVVVILIGIVGYLGGAKLRATIGPDPEAPAQALD